MFPLSFSMCVYITTHNCSDFDDIVTMQRLFTHYYYFEKYTMKMVLLLSDLIICAVFFFKS